MSPQRIDELFPTSMQRAIRAYPPGEYRSHDIHHSNSRFNCRISLHREWQTVDASEAVQGAEMTHLATFRHSRLPEASVEISACRIDREVSPVDWLDLQMIRLNRTTLKRREFESPGGALPDLMSNDCDSGEATVFRTIALKDADRVFVVETRVPSGARDRLLLQLLVSLSSFKLLNPEGVPTAERIRSLRGSDPTFRTVMLESWRLSSPGGMLRMPVVLQNPGPDTVVGEIYLAVIAKNKDSDALYLLTNYLSQLENRGVRGAAVQLDDWAGNPNVQNAKIAMADVSIANVSMDLRIVLLERGGTTALAALLGTGKAVSHSAWAINRRAFEITAGALQLG